MKAALLPNVRRAHEACELRRKRTALLVVAAALALHPVLGRASQPADTHAQPTEHAAAPQDGTEAADHGGEHGGLAGLVWPVANFVILVGGLYYFLRTPFSEYLSGRSTQIRKDLVEAGELTRSANAQLAEVNRKLQAIPGEIASLKQRGVEEIAAEDERIASAAAADRARLLTQTRREIEVRLQTAQRELSEHAASLAVQIARKRLTTEVTPADHARLVDRYVRQVKQ